MRRALPLLVALSRNWLRDREAVFFAFLFPVILLLLFSAVFGGGAADFTIYVQNNDLDADGEPTDLSAVFVEAMNDTDTLTVRTIDPGRNVTAWSREGGTTGATRVVVIPEGFAEQVRGGSVRARRDVILDTMDRAGNMTNGPNQTASRNGSNATARTNGSNGTTARQGLNAMVNATNASGPATVTFLAASDDESAPAIRGVLESIVTRFNQEAIGVDTAPAAVEAGDLGSRNLGGVDYYLPALIAAVVVINGLVTLTTVVAEFTAGGTLKRLVATPLRKRDWIFATVVQQCLLSLSVTALMVVVAHLAFGVTVVPGPLSVALILLGTVAFAGLGMALGSVVRSAEAATSLGMAIALPLMFVSGVFWELDLMPEFLRTVATLLPIYHFHRGLRQLMVVGTTDGVAVPFAILSAGAVLSLALAVRLTNWQDF